ncbi:pregnancy zone protein-like [Sorex fumeus]|uniref:pregnancy zone protein-like n=1 Tax=Sorex fumeus TaxID=62283 RepID=UPI0024AD13A6|nr:pregnancy zone protein-like [Sorex fumeus]
MRKNQRQKPLLILLFLLLSRDASTTPDPQYLVLVPSQLYTGVAEKACVMLNHMNETVTLNVVLEYGLQNGNLLTDVVTKKNSFYCTPFLIPDMAITSALISVHVRGRTQNFIEKKAMKITKAESLDFVQTDKPIYKPGQTVKFRIVSVDFNFRPLEETFLVVYIEDPKKNRVFQRQNLTLQRGLTELSFPLSEEPILGSYKVILQKASGKKTEHSFEVDEYVLPKFEVQVKMPKIIGFLEEEFNVTVCGLYTYGKPVSGLVTINACRKYQQYYSFCQSKRPTAICEEFTEQADNKGCFTQLIKSQQFQLGHRGYEMKIEVEGRIREEGTELELTGHGSSEVTNTLSKLKFTKVDSHYRRGLPFFGQLLLVDEKDQPIPNKTVEVYWDNRQNPHNYTTNEHGLVDIFMNTTNFTSSFLYITVIYKTFDFCPDMLWLEENPAQIQHVAKRVFSPSNSFVHLEPIADPLTCGQAQEIRAHYILNEQILKDEKELIFYYLIKAKGIISQSGTHALSITQGNMKGVFSFSIQVGLDIAPQASLLFYTTLPDGEMIADTLKLEVEKCFANKVDVSFSSAQGLPTSDTKLKVTASPSSLCALRAVDQSVLLMKPEAELSPQSVYNLLPVEDIPNTQRYVPRVPVIFNNEDCIVADDITHNGITYTPKEILFEDDVHTIIESSGFNIFTNSKIYKPRFCQPLQERLFGAPPIPMMGPLPVPGLLGPPIGFAQSGRIGPLPIGAAGPPGIPMGLAAPGIVAPPPMGAGGPPRIPMGLAAPEIVAPPLMGAGGVGAVPPMMGMGQIFPPSLEMKKKETIRKYFPETWIWDLVVLDLSGSKELKIKIPDTITEWKASALCLSGTAGLGLSPITSLQAFQPFFLDLTLPYSVVRGEAFTLKATVFNYLSQCMRISMQLEDSPAFLAVPAEKNEASHCVCGSGQKTVSWAVTPKSLGKMNFTASAEALKSQELCDGEVPQVPAVGWKDTVVKPLLVEPEGIEREESFNTMLCASRNEVTDKLSLKVPSNVVEGSARATYSVLGDMLGSAVTNLQNLLQMPFGCGEQNMVLFVPNIYVLNYLTQTGQLTEKIKAKATSHLVSGYQRQLNYKHSDGSYSAFGEDNGGSQGNTWLTAFVLKSFVQAQAYIYVENSHITTSFTWLSQKQKANGCFQRSGSLLHNAMKGGVDDEVTLSAYITIALLEMPLPVTHPVVRNALFCLETTWRSISNNRRNLMYTKALLAYAFALAGNQIRRNELLRSLERQAVTDDDSIHWERPGKRQEPSPLYYEPRAPSVDVEMTSYLLLAYLTVQPAPSTRDLTVASRIVKWIIKQQNPHGGFSSTQDTVVALQALSKYGAAVYATGEKDVTVMVKNSRSFSEKFQVNKANRLLLQQIRLPEIPGEYTTVVSGTGCVYLQRTLRYNIVPKKEGNGPFTLMVDTVPKNCDGINAHKKIQIHINISYTGKQPSSNMVIVDVKMVSGFIPVKASVKKLQEMPQIQRTEVNTNHVLIYFEKLTSEVVNFSFSVEQDIQVENLKPATVKAYDYYETDEITIKEYTVPCASGTKEISA